jgi:flagellin-like hook-associated protein FlgL
MKQLLILFGMLVFTLLIACNRGRYVNLVSGEHVDLEKDSKTGLMVDSKTHEPVYMYVDTKTNDTIFGATGDVINGHIVKTENGKFKWDGEDEYKLKVGDYKEKVDGDETKIKEGDKKIKIDDGEKKVKKD